MVKTKTNTRGAKARGAASASAVRTVRWIGANSPAAAQARASVESLGGWRFEAVSSAAAFESKAPKPGDVLLLDSNLEQVNAYELCRSLIGKTGCRTYVVTDAERRVAEGIAQFCGASGVLPRKLTAAVLRRALVGGEPRPALPDAARSSGSKAARKPLFPRTRMRDMTGAIDTHLVAAITDPETNLFNYAFLNYKLDEEFKRAQRFGQPLSCVMLGVDGECETQTLRELAGIFLSASRDTDVLGRFDQGSFLFFLPATGPDGARIMAERVLEEARKRRLTDILGERLELSVGVASTPHAKVKRREDLFGAARRACLAAQRQGGVVVLAT